MRGNPEQTNTVIVGAGQAGLAMSAHLTTHNISHIILEKHRLVERWRTARWDSLVANGPAWHDRFPVQEFAGISGDDFATREDIVGYFEHFADAVKAPVRCGVEVSAVTRHSDGGFLVGTNSGHIMAENVVAATGPFQTPVMPPLVPQDDAIQQMHSSDYRNPQQLRDGAVLVIGAGSSGAQIADELLRAGRRVYLAIGPHDRPPRRYRGKDFVWWLGVLGKWQMKTPPAGKAHVTIAVSGAYGGRTVDFRQFAERGMTLLGMATAYEDGVLQFADDLGRNIRDGDANYLALLDEADAYVAREGLNVPEEPEAKIIGPDPACVTQPLRQLDLAAADIASIIWATGYCQDFGWLQVDALDADGRPRHQNGIAAEPGIYFLGLPWLTMRGSSFIWGVWEDAAMLAAHIVKRNGVPR
jgi:putative flavoprotein involved in K+ transport